MSRIIGRNDMRHWRQLFVIGVTVLSLWPATVRAQERPGGAMGSGFGGPEHGMGAGTLTMFLRAMNLTPDQQVQVNQIVATHRPTFQKLMEQARTAHDEMTDRLLGPGPVSADEMASRVQRIAQLRAELMQEGLKVALEVRGFLTPEQLAKASQLKDRIKALREEMRPLKQGNP